MKSSILAKRNSSKELMSRIVSVKNWIRTTMTWPSPDRSCWTPSTGPADTKEVRNIVRSVGMLFFMLYCRVFGLYNFSVVIFIKSCWVEFV